MKKKIIKPFLIEAWKNGAKVETRDGRSVRILCTDFKNRTEPILAAIMEKDGLERSFLYHADGLYFNSPECDSDLVIVEEVEEPKRWADNSEEIDFGWCIDESSKICRRGFYLNNECNFRAFATEKQAKSALAMARISQLMAHDERYGGVVTDEEWQDDSEKYCIGKCNNILHVFTERSYNFFLAFHTEEQCDLFLAEHEQLVKDYLMID